MITYRAVEARTVVIILKCFDPSVSGFNGEAAGKAFCGK